MLVVWTTVWEMVACSGDFHRWRRMKISVGAHAQHHLRLFHQHEKQWHHRLHSWDMVLPMITMLHLPCSDSRQAFSRLLRHRQYDRRCRLPRILHRACSLHPPCILLLLALPIPGADCHRVHHNRLACLQCRHHRPRFILVHRLSMCGEDH